ncbi:DUF229 domain-containing protein [Puteibacter caeruleilacunae]|nr:DUF229 domain-containing protein [Puteibacter caeruleilacunae]
MNHINKTLCLALMGAAVGGNAYAAPSKQQKPNVLMISIDDLNDWSGCLGNFPNIKTPNIDRLAAKGIIFKNAHCQAPICAPSRAAIYMSLQPANTGLYYQSSDKDIRKANKRTADAVFMPDYFEEYGYKTMGVGKLMHNGDALKIYQEYGGVFPKMGFGPKPKERVNYNPKWFSKTRNTATDWSPIDLPEEEMSDYKIADWAVNKLGEKHDQPFFMAVGFIRPHVPWHVPQKWFDMFPLEDIQTPPYKKDDMDDIPEISKQLHDMPSMPKTEWLIKENKWKSMVQAYMACMAFVDHQVGKVLDAMENSEYADNTIIVLWSDHGYHLGEKNRTCKHSLWNRATHVPLIFAGPGIEAKTSCDEAVQLIDIYPTLTALCGLPANKDNEGHNLEQLIDSPDADWRYPAMTMYGFKNVSLYHGDYHFIQYKDGSMEFYDRKNDPNEWDNQANNPKFAKEIKRFKRMLPKDYAPLTKYTKINANKYMDAELKAAGIKVQGGH